MSKYIQYMYINGITVSTVFFVDVPFILANELIYSETLATIATKSN